MTIGRERGINTSLFFNTRGRAMVAISFDPGHHTGFAWVDNQSIKLAGAIRAECLTDDWLNSLVITAKPDIIIIEDLPINRPDAITAKIFNQLSRLAEMWKKAGTTIKLVKPGTWKPIIKNRPKDITPHCQDAVGIALYTISIQDISK